MNIKYLQAYITMCDILGVRHTFEGLKNYYKLLKECVKMDYTVNRLEDKWLEPEEDVEVCDCMGCGIEIYKGQEAWEFDGELFDDVCCILDYLDRKGEIEYVEVYDSADIYKYDGVFFIEKDSILDYLDDDIYRVTAGEDD